MNIASQVRGHNRRMQDAITAIKCIANNQARERVHDIIMQWDIHERRRIFACKQSLRDVRSSSEILLP
jgi:hypothetical protein